MNTSLLGYFRHQFVAAPLTRLLWMVPVIAMLAFGLLGPIRDSTVGVIFSPMILTVFTIGTLSSEDTAYTAYGMPKSRARKLTALSVVPAVVFGASLALLARPDWVGVAGAVMALLGGLTYGLQFADRNQVNDRDAIGSRIGSSSFEFETIFKPQLYWALGVAVAHCVMLYLTSFIGNDNLRQLISGAPIIIWYSAYCMQGLGIPGAATGASYGVPRRRWMALLWAGAITSVMVYIGVVGLASPSEFSWAAVVTTGLGGFACAVFGAALKIWRMGLGLIPGYMMFFIVNDTTDADSFSDPIVSLSLVAAAILLLIGVIIQGGYLMGLINPKHTNNEA